jgi:hypothetical protein
MNLLFVHGVTIPEATASVAEASSAFGVGDSVGVEDIFFAASWKKGE